MKYYITTIVLVLFFIVLLPFTFNNISPYITILLMVVFGGILTNYLIKLKNKSNEEN